MDWNDLRYFLAVAQSGSLSAAAVQLGVSPSTVSRRIEVLERDLQKRLFQPHRDGYDLSAAGRDLVPAAERAAAQLRQFERSAKGAGGSATTVVIEAPELLAQEVLLPALAPFMAAHPDIRIELRGSVHPARLAAEEADLVLRLVRPEKGNYRIRKLRRIGFALYASRDHVAAEGLPRKPEDLPNHRFIGWPESFDYLLMARWLATLYPGLEPQIRLTSLTAQLSAAGHGLGWAVLPDFAARPAGLVRAELETTPLAPDLWLLTHERTGQREAVGQVRKAIEAAAGQD